MTSFRQSSLLAAGPDADVNTRSFPNPNFRDGASVANGARLRQSTDWFDWFDRFDWFANCVYIVADKDGYMDSSDLGNRVGGGKLYRDDNVNTSDSSCARAGKDRRRLARRLE